MNLARWSLRRRIAIGLGAAFLAGYAVLTVLFGAVMRYVVSTNTTCVAPFPFDVVRCGYNFYDPTLPTRLVAGCIVIGLLTLTTWGLWSIAGRLLRPLRMTTDVVRRVGPQNLGQRIRLEGGADELKLLADALDQALDRIAAGYESQRRFASNASHELRTPLAVQRLLTEVAMDDPEVSADLVKLGGLLLRTNERNERLIEGLLVLADSDRGLQGQAPVRLDEIAAAVLDAHREMAKRHGVTVHRRLGHRVVNGDALLLEHLVRNLVVNAILYNRTGGWVEVAVAAEPALTVRNAGEHVPAEAVPTLFEPFRRLAGDRLDHGGGAGLGLSIVRSITQAHSGTVSAQPGSEGGLIVEVSLP